MGFCFGLVAFAVASCWVECASLIFPPLRFDLRTRCSIRASRMDGELLLFLFNCVYVLRVSRTFNGIAFQVCIICFLYFDADVCPVRFRMWLMRGQRSPF